MYTIKQVAELTGTPAATLRAWERRYGVGSSGRTEGGYRLYDEATVAVLRRMGQLVDSGWPASRAAREVAGAGEVSSPTAASVDAHLADLVQAARDLDGARCAQLIDDRFGAAAFEQVVDGWLMPALAEVGRAWQAGDLDIAGEHLVSHLIRAKLSVLLEAGARATPTGPTVVLGLLGGHRHELGLLAYGVAAQRIGLGVCYLGADLPVASWRDAVARTGARAVVTVAVEGDDVAAIQSDLAQVRDGSDLVVAVGGALQDEFAAPVQPLGHLIGPAAVLLRNLVDDNPPLTNSE